VARGPEARPPIQKAPGAVKQAGGRRGN
jgi:hypothetical protein